MLFKKLWRTMGLYKAQFISMIIMIALGIGVFVGFNIEWASIKRNTDSFMQSTGFADYRIVSESGFSEEDADKLSKIKGVTAVARYISVNVDVKERDGDSLALTVTDNEKVSGFIVTSGEKYNADSIDGIWLSDVYAEKNNFKCGDSVTLVYKGFEINGVVKGLIKSSEYTVCVRDETQLLPDYSTYGYAYISPAMYQKVLPSAFYPQLNAISDTDKKDFTAAVDKAFPETLLVLTKDENISYSGISGEIEEGKTMGAVLPFLFLLIAVLTMVTTMHRLTAKEKTQIGTLKALGFKNKRILLHYTSYAFFIGVIGSALGIGLGFVIGKFIVSPDGSMGTYLNMPDWRLYMPGFCYALLAVIIVLLTVIGFLSVKQMLRGSAAEVLCAYAPKKVKPMLIEKTNLFHKLSFGVRWNMRDTLRHKSRTLMTLIGIVGCTLIVFCAVGMRDTMNAFIDLYYNGATNYASRIYLAEDADNAARDAVAQKYNGDESASVSVQLEDKAVSLDIYSITGDKVRFPGKDNGYTKLENDGAYICMRIADKYNLTAGDTFTVSPYGSDKSYTLKVAGIIRSVSENIVISSQYADKLNIPYMFDSVYTDTEKADILPNGAIKSVQSKQMIMDSFDTFMEIMYLMIIILVLGAVVLGIVVLYNLGVMSYTERYREMATLKVVGFKDKKIGRLLIEQNLWITALGVILGIPAGLATLDYMIKTLASEYELRLSVGPATYLSSILLTFGVSLIVSIAVSRKNKKIDMVEALKGAE